MGPSVSGRCAASGTTARRVDRRLGAVSQAASQAAAFYRQAVEKGAVWTVRDEGGYPAPKNRKGNRAQPFWSSRERVERIIKTVPAYASFEPVEITLTAFLEKWVPALERDGFRIGVNWSGPRVVGYDMEPHVVKSAVEANPHFAKPS